MTNLYLSYPAIPFDAKVRSQDVTFSEDRPIGNVIYGERYQYASATAGGSGAILTQWDLGYSYSQAVDHIIIPNAAKLVSQGTTEVRLYTAADGIDGTYSQIWADASFGCDNAGPDGLDYIRYGDLENRITYSEEFDNAYWDKYDSSITANAVTAPYSVSLSNSLLADKLVENTNNTAHGVGYGGSSTFGVLSLSNATSYKFSVYAKAAERTRIFMQVGGGAFANQQTVLDLSAGSVVSNALGGVGSIESIGDGWYRCTLTATTSAASYCYPSIYLVSSGTTASYAGTTGYGLYLWGAQLTKASYSSTYLKTTAAERLSLTTATSTAARTWKHAITGGASTTREINKIYFGTAWNPGKDPDYDYKIVQPDGGKVSTEDGGYKCVRLGDGRYQVNVTWTGVTDAQTQIFYDRVMRYWQVHKYHWFTTGEHRILNNFRVMHVRVLEQPKISRDIIYVAGVRAGYNTINIKTLEVKG